jgi:hypothetical protein
MSEADRPKGRLVTFKRHAHLFTLISVVWTVFTVFAVFFVSDDSKRDYRIDLAAIGVWIVHALYIGLSIHFWRTERESVLWIEPEE